MVLLPSERRLYDYLCHLAHRDGYAPTIREIQDALSLSSRSLVQNLLQRLTDKGFIQRLPRRARAISVQCSQLPLRGTVQAGFFVDHPEGHDRIRLDGQRYQPNDYALRVVGDSMEGTDILADDVVVIRSITDLWAIPPGSIGVVWIDGEGTTLKRIFYREGDSMITLKAASAHHSDRTLERSQVGLQGIMVGHHRLADTLWVPVKKGQSPGPNPFI
jgi:repressor LexA